MNIPRDSNLKPAHYQEWLASGVSPEIIALNVRSLEDLEVVAGNDASYPIAEALNWNVVRFGQQVKGNLRGWWVSGVDPLNDFKPMTWGRFKPDSDTPILDRQRNRPAKYLSPRKQASRLTLLRVTKHQAWNIYKTQNLGEDYEQRLLQKFREAQGRRGSQAKREAVDRSGLFSSSGKGFSVDPQDLLYLNTHRFAAAAKTDYATAGDFLRSEDSNFWREAIATEAIAVVLCEGEKKAGDLLSVGYAAIALPGITSGVRTRDSEGLRLISPHLIPDLALFATPGREVSVCFDYETRLKTIGDVQREIGKLKAQFLNAGCEFNIIDLPGPEKGVDDFIVAQGEEAFHKLFRQRRTYEQWLSYGYSKLTYPVSQALNQRHIGKLDLPATAKLVGIKSAKNTGKTTAFIDLVADAMARGQRVLLISHRVQLAEAICEKIELNYITEVRQSGEGAMLGYGLCIDSLHPESQAQFNADHWNGALIIIDEAEQVFWHLLEAKTEVAAHRIKILEQLKTLLINTLESDTGRVVLADADLSDLSINLVHGLIANQPPPYLIVNSWKPDSEAWQVYNYAQNTAKEWLCALDQELGSGGKPFVVLQSQKRKSKFSTTTLEALFNAKYPHLKILRIDSESIADPTHPAFKCTEHINEVVSQYDCVLASPTLETGVSIDVKGHFTSVWGCMNGVLPENTARQSLARVRDPVDRHLWINKRGYAKAANGFSTKKAILAGEHRQAKFAERILQLEATDSPLVGSYEICLQIWAKMAARVNCGLVKYRNAILTGLDGEGHHINLIDEPMTNTELLEELEERRSQLHKAECEAIANAADISQSAHDKLKKKKAKTPRERQQERKFSIGNLYCVDEVTPELVEKDDDGWFPKLRLHYYLGMGKDFLRHRDEQSLEHSLKTSGAWLPTTNRAQLSTRCWLIEKLGVLALLDIDEDFNGGMKKNDYEDGHPALLQLAKLAIENSWDVTNVIGVSVNEKMSPIQIAQTLLGKLGIKLRCDRQIGGKGNRQRVYRYELPKDGRDAILEGWFSRDLTAQQQREEEALHTPSNKKELVRGVA